MSANISAEVLQALQTLQKHNFKDAELALKREAGLADNTGADEFIEFKAETTHDPKSFAVSYDKVVKFIESCADQHKLELSGLLYPIFVQLYVRLVSGNFSNEAKHLMDSFRRYQEDFYQEDIQVLSSITEPGHLFANPLVDSFRASNFSVSVASVSDTLFRRFLREKCLTVIQSIIKDQLNVEVIEGPPRTKMQLYCRRGATFGEARRDANSETVLYGLLHDPSLNMDASEDTAGGDNDNDTDLTPSKKKRKKEGGISGQKSLKSEDVKGHSRSPALDRIPLPKLSEVYLDKRRLMLRECAQITLSLQQQQQQQNQNPEAPPNRPSGTSSVFYTVCNAQPGESSLAIRRGGVPCAAFSEDLGMLATAMGSGRIRVWSLGAESLRQMLPPEELELLDMNDSRIKSKMLHDENDETHPSRDLIGHQAAVHGIAFSPDGQLIASASADGTLRLWSTAVWGGSLCVWRDHIQPIWCVGWPPAYGHYIATGGADGTARLYACDHAPQPLRIFTGHRSDVTSLAFHPNANYLATGSADRAVRLFDVRSGKNVRLYTGHKGSVQCLAFSPCGRYLASGGWCGATCLWDLGSGAQIGQLGGYSAGPLVESTTSGSEQQTLMQMPLMTGPVVSLAFSPDGGRHLATGGLEGALRVWNISNKSVTGAFSPLPASLLGAHNSILAQESRANSATSRWETEEYYSVAVGSEVARGCLRDAFFTRRSAVLAVQFAHPQLILAAGPFNQV